MEKEMQNVEGGEEFPPETPLPPRPHLCWRFWEFLKEKSTGHEAKKRGCGLRNCGSFYLKFELGLRRILMPDCCAFAPLGARKGWTEDWGCGGRTPSALPLLFRVGFRSVTFFEGMRGAEI